MESFTEIALYTASLVARLHNHEVDSFSLDAVETYTDEHGDEMVKIQVTARIVPAGDDIPFDLPGPNLGPRAGRRVSPRDMSVPRALLVLAVLLAVGFVVMVVVATAIGVTEGA